MSPSKQTTASSWTIDQKNTISGLAQTGQAEAAEKLCRALCKKVPDDPEAWFLLGAIYGQLDNFPEAENCCNQAISLAPQQPMLHFNLAMALQKQGKAAEAAAAFEHAIKLQPGFANAWFELGNTRILNDEPQLAIDSYLQAIQLEPGSHIAIFNLGNAYRILERWHEAVECYRQAIKLAPAFAEAYCEAATVLITRFKFAQAIDLLENAIEHLPDSPEIYLRLAITHQEQGDSDTAAVYFRKTLELDENNVDGQIGIATMQGMKGDITSACESLEKILQAHPGSASAAIAYAHFSHRVDATDKAIKIVEDTVNNYSNNEQTTSKLHFSLGQLHEQKKQTDIAFQHYLTGNKLRGAEFHYQSYVEMFDAIIGAYSEQSLKQFPRATQASRTPVFIVGMPRSGTSLAEQIIASHPDVYGAGELFYINAMIDKLPQTLGSSAPYPQCLEKLTTAVLDRLSGEYIGHLNDKLAQASFFTDKMPLNFMHIGFIELLFPNAKIVHCVRNPVDTCLSCFFKNFSGEHAYAYSLTDLGNFYRLYRKLMTHWESTSGLPIHTLVYEHVVTSQEQETRKLLDFCGLEWDDKCLDFHKTKRTVSTASFDQVRQPIYTGSVDRWRIYEKHLGPLLSALQIEN